VDTEQHTRIEVRVHTGSTRPRIVQKGSGLHLYTVKKPLHGEANSDVIRMISEYFNVPKKNVEIVRGLKSRNKLILVRGSLS
jgi:uncharacterized protein YggU (UPF0235/DUF167 family)